MTQGDWIFHRGLGVGRVIDRSSRSVTAEFSAGRETVDSRFRTVTADSIRVQAHIDLTAVARRMEEDPASIAVAILEEQSPVAVEKLVPLLVDLGVSAPAAERWLDKIMESADDATSFIVGPHDGASEGSLSLSLPASEEALPDVDELLSRIASGELSKDDLASAHASLAAESSEGRLSSAQAAIAGLLGALPKQAALIRDLDIAAVDTAVLRAIVTMTDDLDVLEQVFFGCRRQAEAKAALRKLAKHKRPTSPSARSRLAGPLASMTSSGFESVDEAELERVLQRLALLPHEVIEDLAEPIANMAAESRSDQRADGRIAGAADALLATIASRAPDLIGIARRHQAGAAIGSSLPLECGGFRLSYVAALVGEPVSTRLDAETVWAGVELEHLVQLAESGDALWRRVLEAEAPRRAIGRIVANAVQRGGLQTLARVLSVEGLFELLSEDQLRSALDRLLLADGQLQLIQRLISVEPVAQLRAEQEKVKAEIATSHEAALGALRSEVERLSEELAGQSRRMAFLQNELTRHTGDISEASTAQVRQAWIEAAQVAAEILAESARVGSSGQVSPAMVEGIARSHGVELLGQPGDVVVFDPLQHRMLVGDPVERVEVVEAPIVTSRFGHVTTLRYGLVRPAEGSTQ